MLVHTVDVPSRFGHYSTGRGQGFICWSILVSPRNCSYKRVCRSDYCASLLPFIPRSVYYYFYERTREAILAAPTRATRSKALSTLESMLSGLIAGKNCAASARAFLTASQGTATTLISNPIWVIQVSQATQTLPSASRHGHPAHPGLEPHKLSIVQTVRLILRKDGITAFWRGIGPALVLVVNPILQVGLHHSIHKLMPM